MMIRLEGITKRFGSVEALGPVDLEIREGEWLGLFGHNGSGKTTLIRILLGLTRPSAGRLLIGGGEPGARDWHRLRARLGFMPERIAFYEHMSGEEVLDYFRRLRGADRARVPELLRGVGLAGAARRKVGEYSKGMRQRLNLAQALLGRPEVLALDEPIEGLDPRAVREMFALLRAEGVRTVVLSSHRLAEVCREVDRVCVLEQGLVKATGSVDELVSGLARPARIHIWPEVGTTGLRERLGALVPAGAVVSNNGKLVVELPQDEKTAFLLDLSVHRDAIGHVRVEEAGLEEVWHELD